MRQSLFYFRQHEWSGWNVIYRARPVENNESVPYSKVSDFSYRPEDQWTEIVNYGRVNKPGEANFYGAFEPGTACFECVFKRDEFRAGHMIHVNVGVWKIDAPLNLVQIPYSEKYYAEFYSQIKYQSRMITEEAIKDANFKLREQLGDDLAFEILTYFADAFANFNIESENDYFLTNYYADRVFNQIAGFLLQENIDGILYPSVANSYENKNIVLVPEAVKKKLKFLQADHYGITHNPENGGSVSFLPFRIRRYPDKEGNIIWDLKG
ncbi:MAG: RES domain-containing protein [Bacteroidetes bacterium]|nr:RES domain-containing protein [Bacteroidota bacterium]